MSATRALVLPGVGDRVGMVCGPGDDPAERAGTVIALERDSFHWWAVVRMDDGTEARCYGLRTVGIGWNRLPRGTERRDELDDSGCAVCRPFPCDDPDRPLGAPSDYTPLRNRGCHCGADFDGRDCMCFEDV